MIDLRSKQYPLTRGGGLFETAYAADKTPAYAGEFFNTLWRSETNPDDSGNT